MPEPSPAPEQQTRMPTPTRVAVILLSLLAVLLLLNVVLTWLTQEAEIDRTVASGGDRDAAAQFVVVMLLAYAVIGVSAVLAALFLPRRRQWARSVGLLVTSLLVVMTVFSAVTGGGLSPVALLALAASVVGFVSLRAADTKAWVVRR